MRKAVIVGIGNVGSCVAQTLALESVFDSMVLVDKRFTRAEAESADLMTALPRMGCSASVVAGSYSDASDADIVILCAAAPARLGQTRNDMFVKNAQIVQDVVSNVEGAGFTGRYLVVSNPVDLLVWHIVNDMEIAPSRVFGTGTLLDSMRLEDVVCCAWPNACDVRAFAFGEHGEGLVVDWDNTSVDGCAVRVDDRESFRRAAIDAAYNIMKGKGSTSYGIAVAVSRALRAWSKRSAEPLPLTISSQDAYGIDGIALSLPVRFDDDGVPVCADIELSDVVVAKLRDVANDMRSEYTASWAVIHGGE